ncbi:MAG: sigma-70 family RNA polymerase sigma factor [Planctomycetes bacterium]|nr:sigma-70 family RNA polymerase sigma factor [Planctomycetota bacterium]
MERSGPVGQDTASAAGQAWISHLYGELHAMARRCFSDERRSHTLQPTALVHEALMRMAKYTGPGRIDAGDRGSLALAAVVMRRVLVDHARQRKSREGAEEAKELLLPLPSCDGGPSDTSLNVLVFHEMLQRLSRVDSRAAHVIELRFFGGLTVPEVSNLLGLSDSTVEADSRFALAWMRRDMAPSE